MKLPLSQSGAGEPSVKAKRARKDGQRHISLSGYPWQEWLVTMTDGTVRRTHVPASGRGSGPRAARRDAEGEGPYRDLSQPTYKESIQRAVMEGRRNAHPDAGKTATTPVARPEASNVQVTATNPDKAEVAKDPQSDPPVDFPNPVVPGTRAGPAAPPRATGQAHRPPTRRAL